MEGSHERDVQEDPPSHLIAPQDRGDLCHGAAASMTSMLPRFLLPHFLLSSLYLSML